MENKDDIFAITLVEHAKKRKRFRKKDTNIKLKQSGQLLLPFKDETSKNCDCCGNEINADDKRLLMTCIVCRNVFCTECRSNRIWNRCKNCEVESKGRAWCDCCEQWVDEETLECMDDDDREFSCGHCGMPMPD